MQKRIPLKIVVSEIIIFLLFIPLLSLFLYMFFYNLKGIIRIIISISFLMIAFLWENPLKGVLILSPLILIFSLKWYFWYTFLYPFSISKGGGILVPVHFLDIIALLFGIFYIPYKLSYNKDKISDPFSFFLILQILIFFISSFKSYDTNYSLIYLSFWITGFLFYRGILWAVSDKNLYKNFVFFLFLLLFANLLLGSFQAKFGYVPVLGGVMEIIKGGIWSKRIKGVFAHPNSFSGVFAILIPFFMGWTIYLWDKLKTWIKIFLCFLFLWTIALLLFTYSRIGYLSFFSSLISFLFLWSFFTQKKLKIIKIIFGIILGVTVFLIIVKLFFPLVYLRLLTLGWGEKEVSIAIRLAFWKKSLKAFLKDPFIGIGIAQFAYQPYSLFHLHPHNYFIGLLLETGIFGFIASFSFLIYVFYLLWKETKISKNTSSKWIWIGLLSGWIALTVHLMADMVWVSLTLSEERKIYWMFIGLTSLTLFHYGEFGKKFQK